MKTYRGCADGRSVMVDIDDGGKKGFIGSYPLAVRLDLRNHSPDGFAWGYGGSGPSQLALAILADYAGDKVAGRFYQTFKERVIARLPMDRPFELPEAQIERAMTSVDLHTDVEWSHWLHWDEL